jgi:hypothetical protein
MKNLGCMNGWQGEWAERCRKQIAKCRAEGHERKNEILGRCYCRETCEKCGYTFTVDSGD